MKKMQPPTAKKTKPKKAGPKTPPAGVQAASTAKRPTKPERERGLSSAELRELMKTNKPPQSWYDEDHTGLY